ncbi:BCL2/adenovirus E1B 19 kDa protein-interacting protein 3 [Denticeps clupeoides]|uniref:BCL2/adenovirus E1B 19 kDa protein-interacting protein 3-like n=1 Tax=Denticeps clupeoides TaxID=299321 RepID=A0AAY4E3M7_9TELE|nr:BCL2/adenovirus E1B 19 kDa protein-interacting protein 3-like [Denticeps clupeoides]
MSLSGSQSPEDSLHGSWVELEGLVAAAGHRESLTGQQNTMSSLLQGELERILQEAQLESERSSHTDSPPQVVTPQTSGSPRPTSEGGSSSTDCVTIQSDDGDRMVSSDWVWDWSSRPENLPPKEFVFQHPKSGTLSVRKSEVMKRGLFSSDMLLILLPSLLASHVLTLGLGIYIGKRLASSSSSTL